tara:strand:+ start:16 stop:159 length:144 start_codon:yes stop_codon:yes gene_type:complete
LDTSFIEKGGENTSYKIVGNNSKKSLYFIGIIQLKDNEEGARKYNAQ